MAPFPMRWPTPLTWRTFLVSGLCLLDRALFLSSSQGPGGSISSTWGCAPLPGGLSSSVAPALPWGAIIALLMASASLAGPCLLWGPSNSVGHQGHRKAPHPHLWCVHQAGAQARPTGLVVVPGAHTAWIAALWSALMVAALSPLTSPPQLLPSSPLFLLGPPAVALGALPGPASPIAV